MSKGLALTLGALLLGGCGAMSAHHGTGGPGHGGNRATATHGLTALQSPYTLVETMNRLEAEVKKRNLAVVAGIAAAVVAK